MDVIVVTYVSSLPVPLDPQVVFSLSLIESMKHTKERISSGDLHLIREGLFLSWNMQISILKQQNFVYEVCFLFFYATVNFVQKVIYEHASLSKMEAFPGHSSQLFPSLVKTVVKTEYRVCNLGQEGGSYQYR